MEIIALKVAGFVFLTVSILQLLRVLFKVKVTANNFVVPVWLSVIASVVALLLALFMFAAAR